MLEGSCHCGAVRWRFDGFPESATACNCTLCRRYGHLVAYGFEQENIQVSGPTRIYIRGDGDGDIEFHFCPNCGCEVYERASQPQADGRRRMSVNLRMAEPAVVAAIPVRHFDGLESFTSLGADGRCVKDMWF